MTCYDLHSHSTASDGSLSPEALVKRAISMGVDVLALTDHDGTEGYIEAKIAASNTPLTVIPGVEISVTWAGQTIHVVGLKIDPNDEVLQKGLSELREYRHTRALAIAEKLNQYGITGAYEGASRFASKTMLGRVHFARFLQTEGYVDTIAMAFKKFLVKNKPGYVSGQWATLEQAISWICQAGGQAVIAHPGRYKMTTAKLKRLINEFIELGGVGIEVVAGRQSAMEIQQLAHLASDFELLASRGSDFHSAENPWIELGRLAELPQAVTPIWQSWSQ